MKRINIYEEEGYGQQEYKGWFDLDAATEIARHKSGSSYVSGKILFATAKGKLVVNHWNNTGADYYEFAEDAAEICSILVAGGYDGDEAKMAEILEKYQI